MPIDYNFQIYIDYKFIGDLSKNLQKLKQKESTVSKDNDELLNCHRHYRWSTNLVIKDRSIIHGPQITVIM